MIIKYAVYDAVNGGNTLYNTKDEALLAFWSNVVNLAKTHFHNTAYAIVEQNDDGSEIWKNDNNQEIDLPRNSAEVQAMLDFAKALENPTPIETLP
jgi:hypothetical protein